MKLTAAAGVFALAMTLAPAVHAAHADKKHRHKETMSVVVPVPMRSATSPGILQAEEKMRRVAGGADLVDAETFEETRAVTVKDMFEFSPGVLAQSRVNEESRLSIRGSGLSRNFHLRGLNLYQDGIPINLADGSADFQDIDPLALRYVEVYRGGNALALGSATLGGAINYVTPTGYDAARAYARGELGSFGFRRGQLSSGQVIGDSDYFISLSDLEQDGYRDQSEMNNRRLFSNFGHKINDQLETRFYFTYGDVNQELPGNLTKAQLRNDPKQANPTNAALNYQRDFHITRVANKTTWRGDGLTLTGGMYTQQKNLYHPIFQLIDQQSATYGAYGNGETDGTLLGRRNQFTFGAQWGQGDTDSRRFDNLAGNYGTLRANGREKAKNATLYAEDRLYVRPDLALIGGGQLLYANRNFEDLFLANGDQSSQRDYYGISPKIGALWDASSQVQFFGNVSRAYEPPTLSELTQAVPGFTGFADIKAQKSLTAEIGSRGTFGRWEWDATLYRAWIDDELMMYNIAPGTSRVLNADNTIHQGVELGLGIELAKGLTHPAVSDTLKLRAVYNYNDFRFDGDATYGDNQIPGAPKHSVRAELRYDHPDGWNIAPNVEAVPDGYPVDMANTLESAGYVIAGIRAGYDLTEEAELFVDARNLLDKRYAATADVITAPTPGNQAVFAPGDGRAVYMGLSYRF